MEWSVLIAFVEAQHFFFAKVANHLEVASGMSDANMLIKVHLFHRHIYRIWENTEFYGQEHRKRLHHNLKTMQAQYLSQRPWCFTLARGYKMLLLTPIMEDRKKVLFYEHWSRQLIIGVLFIWELVRDKTGCIHF